MKRFSLSCFFSAAIVLFLTSCTAPVSSAPPPIPFEDPNILGLERTEQRTLVSIEDAVACLASKRPVYGIMTDNTNVRPGSAVGSCRVGRVPQGTIVRVDGLYAAGEATPLADINGIGADLTATPIGYNEDVQPIFERTCNSCHSGVVQTKELQVTAYGPLMAGSENGPVVVPGKPEESLLWEMIATGQMPMIGELSQLDQATVRLWIEAGAPERRSALPRRNQLWASIDDAAVEAVNNGCTPEAAPDPGNFVNADLILPMSCGAQPAPEAIAAIVDAFTPTRIDGNAAAADVDAPSAAAAVADSVEGEAAAQAEIAAASARPVVGPVYAGGSSAAAAGIQAGSAQYRSA